MARIMIYSTPRSGSNYVNGILNDYTDLTWWEYPYRSELYNNVSDEIYGKYLAAANQYARNSTNLVWKMHPNELLVDRLKPFQSEIHEMITIPDYVLAITRRNLVEVTISHSISAVNNCWIPPWNYDRFSIRTEFFEYMCQHVLGNYYTFIDNVYNVKIDRLIFFEDLVKIPRYDLKYLNLSTEEPIYNKIKKNMSPAPAKHELVSNYEHLYDIASEYFDNISNDRLIIKNGILTAIAMD